MSDAGRIDELQESNRRWKSATVALSVLLLSLLLIDAWARVEWKREMRREAGLREKAETALKSALYMQAMAEELARQAFEQERVAGQRLEDVQRQLERLQRERPQHK